MILIIAKLLTRFFGVDLQKAQRIVFWALALGGLVLILVFGLWLRSCFSKPPKLDQKEIIEAQQAIEKNDREKMVEILAESDTKEAAIDSNIKLIEQATEDAKKNYTGLTNDQLAEELNRRAKE